MAPLRSPGSGWTQNKGVTSSSSSEVANVLAVDPAITARSSVCHSLPPRSIHVARLRAALCRVHHGEPRSDVAADEDVLAVIYPTYFTELRPTGTASHREEAVATRIKAS